MESSTVLAFRIFVMLACLIVVPMAAIFGSAFPDVVKTVLVDRLVAWGTGKSPEPAGPPEGFLEGAPQHPAAQASAAGWEAPRWNGQPAGTNTAWQQPQNTPPTGDVVTAGATVPSVPTGGQPAGFAPPPQDPRVVPGAFAPPRGGTEMAPRNLPPNQPVGQPINYPARTDAPPYDRGAQVPPRGQQPVEQPERFGAIERRLREYGATYYLLETWGNEGELYRFYCKMAIAGNPSNTRDFEATDRDALRAMGQVLDRVEAWRSGRL